MCRGVKSVPPWVNRVKVQIVMISSEATDISINWSKNAWDWSINSRPGPLLSSPCPRLVLLWPNCGSTAHWGRGWSACICFTHLLPPIPCPLEQDIERIQNWKDPKKVDVRVISAQTGVVAFGKENRERREPFPDKRVQHKNNTTVSQKHRKNFKELCVNLTFCFCLCLFLFFGLTIRDLLQNQCILSSYYVWPAKT